MRAALALIPALVCCDRPPELSARVPAGVSQPLTALSLSPVPHTVAAPSTTDLEVTFDAAPVAVDAARFPVYADGNLVPGSYVLGQTTAFAPAAPLAPGARVAATLTAAIEDGTATPLTPPLVWTFTVATAPDSTGTFTTAAASLGSATNWSRSIALGDLNGDDLPDAVIGNDGGDNVVYWNDGTAGFPTSLTLTSGTVTRFVALGDLDNDGYLDIVVANDGETDFVCINDGAGGFTTTAFGGNTDRSMGLAIGDVDADGDLDVAVGQFSAQDNVYLNDGTGQLTAGVRPFGTSNDATRVVALGDIDDDGDLDVASGTSNNAQQNAVYLNDGAGNFDAGTIDLGTSSPSTYGLVLGDIDNDGDLDAVIGCYGCADEVRVNDGSGGFGTSLSFGTGSDDTRGVALGDVDGNGELDIAVSYSNTGQNTVFLNIASSLQASPLCSTGDTSRDLAVADVDGDGDLDVAVANGTGSGEQDVLCLNDGTPASCIPTASSDTTCDDVDDDCDGMADDDYLNALTTCGVGACASSGTRTCVSGQEIDDCTPASPIGPDTTCDGVDDDCNDAVDDAVDVEAACGPAGPCTVLACNGQCETSEISGCCEAAADCTTPSACVVGACVGNTCQLTLPAGCCSDATDCDDADACTVDSCESNGACRVEPIADCCNSNADCDDGDPCSVDTCTTDHRCSYRPGSCDTGPPCGSDTACVYSDLTVEAVESPTEAVDEDTEGEVLHLVVRNGALPGSLDSLEITVRDMDRAVFGPRALALRAYVRGGNTPVAEAVASADQPRVELAALDTPIAAGEELDVVITARVAGGAGIGAALAVLALAAFILRRRLVVLLLLALACGRVGYEWRTTCALTVESLTFAVGPDQGVRIDGLPREGPGFDVRF